jgi:hypothetical protein
MGASGAGDRTSMNPVPFPLATCKIVASNPRQDGRFGGAAWLGRGALKAAAFGPNQESRNL